MGEAIPAAPWSLFVPIRSRGALCGGPVFQGICPFAQTAVTRRLEGSRSPGAGNELKPQRRRAGSIHFRDGIRACRVSLQRSAAQAVKSGLSRGTPLPQFIPSQLSHPFEKFCCHREKLIACRKARNVAMAPASTSAPVTEFAGIMFSVVRKFDQWLAVCRPSPWK
jgi:hypothetical protein